jgi:hypothetical protein
LNSEPEAEEITASAVINPVVPLDQHRAWLELRALWRRGHAADDTAKTIAVGRAIFGKVCNAGADGAEILAAAKTWVAAFEAGDGVRFLPALTVWLVTRGWEKPPPVRKIKFARAGKFDQRRRKDGLPRSNGGKRNVANEFFALSVEYEAAEAGAEVVS